MWFSPVLHSTARLAAVLAFAIAGASFESFQLAPSSQGCETIASSQSSLEAVGDLIGQPCKAPQSHRAAVASSQFPWLTVYSPALDFPAGTRSGRKRWKWKPRQTAEIGSLGHMPAKLSPMAFSTLASAAATIMSIVRG